MPSKIEPTPGQTSPGSDCSVTNCEKTPAAAIAGGVALIGCVLCIMFGSGGGAIAMAIVFAASIYDFHKGRNSPNAEAHGRRSRNVQPLVGLISQGDPK